MKLRTKLFLNPSVKLFYKVRMNSKYKDDENAIRNIINDNISLTDTSNKFKKMICYKTKRTSTLISKNNPAPNTDDLKKRKAIYHFSCLVEGCLQKYVGMATTHLKLSCHLPEGAKFKYFRTSYHSAATYNTLLKSVEITATTNDDFSLS